MIYHIIFIKFIVVKRLLLPRGHEKRGSIIDWGLKLFFLLAIHTFEQQQQKWLQLLLDLQEEIAPAPAAAAKVTVTVAAPLLRPRRGLY